MQAEWQLALNCFNCFCEGGWRQPSFYTISVLFLFIFDNTTNALPYILYVYILNILYIYVLTISERYVIDASRKIEILSLILKYLDQRGPRVEPILWTSKVIGHYLGKAWKPFFIQVYFFKLFIDSLILLIVFRMQKVNLLRDSV